MKRDMDLIRNILRSAENASGTVSSSELTTGNFSDEMIAYHFKLLEDAGFTTGSIAKNEVGQASDGVITGLTWKGHEFLDMCRKDSIWEKAKSKALEITGGLAVEVLKECLKKTCIDLLSGPH